MAYPTLASTTGTALSSNTTPQSVDMPATVNAGDLLILVYASRIHSAGASVPGGWTTLQAVTDSGSAEVFAACKIAAGDEGGGTVSVTLANGRAGAAQVLRVTGWYGTISGGCEEGGTAQATSNAAPNAGEMTPSWGSAETLWIWYVGVADDDETVTGAPSGYSGLTSTKTGNGVNASASVGTASKQATAASDDPGAGSINDVEDWVTGVIAVRPAEAASLEAAGDVTLPALEVAGEGTVETPATESPAGRGPHQGTSKSVPGRFF